jgi:hypothetical protein
LGLTSTRLNETRYRRRYESVRDPSEPAVAAAIIRARDRAAELQSFLAPLRRRFTTLGAGVTELERIIIGTSEGRGYLRPEVAEHKAADEIVACEDDPTVRHAEDNIVVHAGKTLLAVGAGNKICEDCEGRILGVEAVPASACRSGRTYA